MIYILTLIMLGSGSAVDSTEYNSKQACEEAAVIIEKVQRERRPGIGSAYVIAICTSKG